MALKPSFFGSFLCSDFFVLMSVKKYSGALNYCLLSCNVIYMEGSFKIQDVEFVIYIHYIFNKTFEI